MKLGSTRIIAIDRVTEEFFPCLLALPAI